MPLKRGLVRESCDFCYRRKLKCDRAMQINLGRGCAQCSARGEQCLLDDSGDIRRRRRRPQKRLQREMSGYEAHETPSSVLYQHVTPQSGTSSMVSTNSCSASYDDLYVGQDFHELFPDNYFNLSLENVDFLDHVFGNDANGTLPLSIDFSNGAEGLRAVEDVSSQQSALAFASHQVHDHLQPALRAYFDVASLGLPVLQENAFWEDYNAGRCSEALAAAIACQGMPFTRVPDKWTAQQQFAHKFREAFLKSSSNSLQEGAARLDDLEALAIMIDFAYDNDDDTDLHTPFGKFFLSHESLVLMTLQSVSPDCSTTASSLSGALANASERRTLLYWHVYALDAFYCLDKKKLSHIPHHDILTDELLSSHEAKGYFDAILALAIIARRILQVLCSAAVKRSGIPPKEVSALYDHLRLWRKRSQSQNLELAQAGSFDDSEDGAGTSSGALPPGVTELHRAVLCALDVNCALQLESCVSDFGFDNKNPFVAEAAAFEVESESVRAMDKMVELCHWMEQHHLTSTGGRRLSLVDAGPSVLRNSCAGVCYWACQRAIMIGEHGLPLNIRNKTSKQQHLAYYLKAAGSLRDAVAGAVSHAHTGEMVNNLDHQCERVVSMIGE